MSGKSLRGTRRLERPRPLHGDEKGSSGTMSPTDNATLLSDATDEEVLNELESLHVSVNNGNLDKSTVAQIVLVCNLLKAKGALIEQEFKEQLDCYFVTLRNASRDERLDVTNRLRLLEVIELRAMDWQPNENIDEYYRQKYAAENPHSYDFTPLANSSSTQLGYASQPSQQASLPASASPLVSLQPTDILKSSGKFGKPVKIPGRNFLKDEIVIKNSDSGKVNPGVRDRLVQITGANEDNILRAKDLIEDTIRRNASPIRDVGDENCPANYGMAVAKESQASAGQKPSLVHSYSMGDASMNEYTREVNIGRDTIRVSGRKEILVKTAKVVLDKYFGEHYDDVNKVMVESRGSYVSPDPVPLSNSRSGGDVSRSAPCHWLGVRRFSVPASSQASSSSDDETFKDDGADLGSSDKGLAPSPKHIVKSTSIAKSLPTQIKFVAKPPPPSSQGKVYGSTPDTAAKVDRSEVPSSASVEAAQPPQLATPTKVYSREFLLSCARSPLSTRLPPDFPSLDPEVASLMVRQPATPFDSDGFRQRMMRQASVSDFVPSSPVSSTPPRSELSELDDSGMG